MESERDPDLYRTDKYIIKYTYGKTAFEENAVFLFRNYNIYRCKSVCKHMHIKIIYGLVISTRYK